jgi:nucleoside-diphosphate-sugar epimerase
MSSQNLIVGAGYLGVRVANIWARAGVRVVATTRSSWLEPINGLNTVNCDVTSAKSWAGLVAVVGEIRSVVYAVGYDRTAGPDIHAVYATGLQNVLAALPSSVSRVIYISTTGVYGSAGGEWVDELTPPDPQRDGGRASLAAEQVLAAHALGRRSAILRLAGLYGPGRVPHLDKLRAGEPIPAPAQGWLNLIHVDDAARIVVAADAWLASLSDDELTAQPGPHIFCVSDGHPVTRSHYYSEVARVLGAPPPKFVEPPPDSPAASRAAASRRVRNAKMRATLGITLDYPTHCDGLASILGGGS